MRHEGRSSGRRWLAAVMRGKRARTYAGSELQHASAVHFARQKQGANRSCADPYTVHYVVSSSIFFVYVWAKWGMPNISGLPTEMPISTGGIVTRQSAGKIRATRRRASGRIVDG